MSLVQIKVSRTRKPVEVVEVRTSADGSRKMIQAVNLGPARATIETGRYLTSDGDKLCLSSQIGCNMACSFCVTGMPFEYTPGVPRRLLRNLTSEEIVAQAENALAVAPPRTHDLGFAFMGMGEPFANLRQVERSIVELGRRYPRARATISTIGHSLTAIVGLGHRVAAGSFPIPVHLHISLHGSRDESRKRIVPHARPLADTCDAAEAFARLTGSSVKLNYVLVAGQNDSADDAERLGRHLAGRSGLVLKLSRLNEIDGHSAVSDADADRFEAIVRGHGVTTYRFVSMGVDIQAGCGELAKGQLIETILAVVQRPDGRILALKRRADADHGGQWSIISGKLEQGEHVRSALWRELDEEVGLQPMRGEGTAPAVLALPSFRYQSDDSDGRRYLVHPFIIEPKEPIHLRINRDEHVAHTWVDANELRAMNIALPLHEELEYFRANGLRCPAPSERLSPTRPAQTSTIEEQRALDC